MGHRKRWPDRRNLDDFHKGVIYAASWLVAAHDKPTIALELLETSGWTKKELRKNMDQFDPWDRKNLMKLSK